MTRPLPVTAYAAVSPDNRIDYDAIGGSEETAKIAAAQWYEPEIPLRFTPVTILPTEQYEAMVEAFSNLLAFTKFELKGTANAERQPWKRLVQKSEDALSALKEQDHAQ